MDINWKSHKMYLSLNHYLNLNQYSETRYLSSHSFTMITIQTIYFMNLLKRITCFLWHLRWIIIMNSLWIYRTLPYRLRWSVVRERLEGDNRTYLKMILVNDYMCWLSLFSLLFFLLLYRLFFRFLYLLIFLLNLFSLFCCFLFLLLSVLVPFFLLLLFFLVLLPFYKPFIVVSINSFLVIWHLFFKIVKIRFIVAHYFL